jgi:hypothetical protein
VTCRFESMCGECHAHKQMTYCLLLTQGSTGAPLATEGHLIVDSSHRNAKPTKNAQRRPHQVSNVLFSSRILQRHACSYITQRCTSKLSAMAAVLESDLDGIRRVIRCIVMFSRVQRSISEAHQMDIVTFGSNI